MLSVGHFGHIVALVALVLMSLAGATSGREAGNRITYGRPVKRFAAPYLVRIVKDDGFFCNGAILNNYNVLTAATCVHDLDGVKTQAKMIVKTSCATKYDCLQEVPVHSFVAHEEFDSSQIPNRGYTYHDLAVLRTSTPIELFSRPIEGESEGLVVVKNINISNDLSLDNADYLYMFGFGDYKDDQEEEISNQGEFVRWGIFSRPYNYEKFEARCKEVNPKWDKESQICAGKEERPRPTNTCFLDLGLPLIQPQPSKLALVGIAKQTFQCGPLSYFERVSYHAPWIVAAIYRLERDATR